MVVESYGQECNGRDPVKSEGLKKDGSTRDVKYVSKMQVKEEMVSELAA